MISVIRPCQAKFLRTQFRWIRNFQNFEKDDFTYILNTLNLDDICWIEDPNEQVQALTAALNLAADWTCPLSVVQNRVLIKPEKILSIVYFIKIPLSIELKFLRSIRRKSVRSEL